MTVLNRVFALAGLLVLGMGHAAASPLYVTDGDSARLAIVDTNTFTVSSIANTHVRGYPLAVRDTIWIGDYNGNQPNAIEYDLAGNPTGNTALYNHVFAVDGAVNGNTNYALGQAFGSSSNIYSANADWTNQVVMFNVTSQFGRLVGITYDTVNGSLWISDAANIYEYSLGGQLLSQFGHSTGDGGALAYERSTDTIWLVARGNANGDLIQFAKDGTLLQQQNVPNLLSNNWGAEFANVPEPVTLVLLGIGLAAMGARRRMA